MHLPWKHYYASVRSLLKLADISSSNDSSKSTGKERLIFSTICGILDAWHFSITVERSAQSHELVNDHEMVQEEQEEEEDGGGGDGDEGETEDRPSAGHIDVSLSPASSSGQTALAALTQSLIPTLLRLMENESKDKKGNKVRKFVPRWP